MERVSGQAMAWLRPPVPRLVVVVVSRWSDAFGASPPPGGEIGHESVSRCGALCLLNDGGLHQCPEVPVDCLFLGVIRLEKATQKHCGRSDVLTSLSELWGIVPPVHDVALDLAGVTPGAARRFMCTGRSVVCRARRRRWRLVLPSLL